MIRKLGLFTVFAATALTFSASSAWAGPFDLTIPITDFTFDSDTLGSPPPQTTPGTDPFPQHIVYSVNPDTGGAILVKNVGTMTKAADMLTSDSGTGESFIDTEFEAFTHAAMLDFDLDIVTAPATGLPQAVGNAPNGQAFIINTFDQSSAHRVFRFVATPTSGSGGVFGLRNTTDGSLILIPGGSYNNGDTHHVHIYMDFDAQTTSAYLDGALTPNLTVPMIDAGASGLSEFFIFQDGVSGVPNEAAFDNFIAFIPEPASLFLLGAGGLCLLRRRKA